MSLKNVKVVPKFTRANVVDFGAVFPNGETQLIARIVYPLDGQIGDSVEANKAIVEVLSKRIKKSVP
ncbi:MAG: hypothetical protein K2O91_10800 [Lachnospiraceae bacterium]|nr:hypothetical protein [Lachnospiraceae bacterium]